MVIDTNIILRYLLRDDAELFVKSSDIIESGDRLEITDVVIMECVYVMAGLYGKKRDQIAAALTMFLQQDCVTYAPNLADYYLRLYSHYNLDLSDCYLIAYAIRHKSNLKTFDKRMNKIYQNEIINL